MQVSTDIPGTTQSVLVATIPTSSSPASTTLTWYPYVSASGTYDIFVLVPGCTQLQDCARRTSVKVTVFPGGNSSPRVATISQRVETDTMQLVYSGPIYTSGPSFVTTVSMSLADQPEGNGSGGKFDIVADRVQMRLKSVNTSGAVVGSNGTNGTLGIGSQGFGFFEFPLSGAAGVDAGGILPNSTLTPADQIAFQLSSALGGGAGSSANSTAAVRAVAAATSNLTFVAGSFALSSGATNIVSFDGVNTVAPLTGNGLNGIVNAMVFDSGILYAGGAFQDTVAGGTGSRLRSLARYDTNTREWSAMEGGVNGVVTGLSLSNKQLSITGNFTRTLSGTGQNEGAPVGGLAVWDIASSEWTSSGAFLVGSMTFTSATTADKSKKGDSDQVYLAGNVLAAQRFGADGWAMLESDKNGQAVIKSTGTLLSDGGLTSSPAAAPAAKKRSTVNHWLPRRLVTIFPRQSTPATLPAAPLAPAPAVLAGTFWTNTSSSHEVIVVGGNFSFSGPSGLAQNVALYDSTSKALTPISGSQVNGIARTLAVVGSQLFVGGQFTIQGLQTNGFAAYDLVKQAWKAEVPGLTG